MDKNDPEARCNDRVCENGYVSNEDESLVHLGF